MDIIIFGGQSNMQGQTECLSDTTVVANAFEYKWLDLHALGAACYGYTNMVPKFCEAYLQNKLKGLQVSDGADMLPGAETDKMAAKEAGRAESGQSDQQVIAVHAAKGSTKIEEWLPGTEGYKFLIGKALDRCISANTGQIRVSSFPEKISVMFSRNFCISIAYEQPQADFLVDKSV